jgi:hypothetical protein
LRGFRIIPQAGIFYTGIEFVQTALRYVPVKDASSAARATA